MPATYAQIFKPARILVPVDFSVSSNEAVKVASDLAMQFGAEVFLLHLIPMFPIISSMQYSNAVLPEQGLMRYGRNEADKSMHSIVEQVASRGIRVSSSVDVGDDVVGNIMRVQDSERSDLIVISTHGLSGWRPIVFGSIAEKVIKLAHCSVLLLRTQQEKVSS